MTIYKTMQDINKLMRQDIHEINRSDAAHIGWDTDNNAAEIPRYLGCNAVKVADLFNVTFPDRKFTGKELNQQKLVETYYSRLGM